MHARVIFFNVKEGKQEETISLFSNIVVPAAKKRMGFSDGLLPTDPATGKGMSMGLWATEAHMIARKTAVFTVNRSKIPGALCSATGDGTL